MALPAVAAFDWQWAAALCFGLVSGWFCRAAIPYMNQRPWSEIKREFVVSIMISGGSLFATLWFARMMEADVLAVGCIAWGISFGGLKALSLAYDFVLLPVKNAIGKSPEQLMSERNQEAQKLIAAARLAEAEAKKNHPPDGPN